MLAVVRDELHKTGTVHVMNADPNKNKLLCIAMHLFSNVW